MGHVDVKMPWPAKFARNVRIVEMFAEGHTLREIADAVGTPLSNVSIILQQAGIKAVRGRRERADSRRRAGERTPREKAIARARELGETLASIATRYSVSKQRIAQIIARMPLGEAVKAKWTDASSYSRGERGNVEPSCWDLEGCLMRISVHRYHGCEGWFYSVPELSISGRSLAAKELEPAKIEAVTSIRSHLQSLTKSLERIAVPSSEPVNAGSRIAEKK